MLDAIYAAFAEGWTDPGGTDAARRDLTEEAICLWRGWSTELLPEEPEALGLLALMLHAEARRGARRDADGDYVPLAEQDPALWDWPLIDEAEALLRPRERAWASSAAISWRRRCSRRTSIAAAPATPTGPRSCSSTTRCWRLPARRSSRSTARWRSPRRTAPMPGWRP